MDCQVHFSLFIVHFCYQIFFYDENDRFLEATEILSDKYVEQKLLPTYARIVIYPSTLDEEGNRPKTVTPTSSGYIKYSFNDFER